MSPALLIDTMVASRMIPRGAVLRCHRLFPQALLGYDSSVVVALDGEHISGDVSLVCPLAHRNDRRSPVPFWIANPCIRAVHTGIDCHTREGGPVPTLDDQGSRGLYAN